MVDFTPTPEQKAMVDLAHQFAAREIRPAAAYYDEVEEMPWEIMRKAHEIGLTSYNFPEEYGGGGMDDPLTGVMVTEELAWGCAGIATAINATRLCATAILKCGTEEQKRKYISRFCDPKELAIGAMGLTEPGAGSDVAAIATTARLEGDEWVLNGSKIFITNGGIADIHVIFATTDRSLGWKGIQAFIVEKGAPGLSMGRKEKKLGVRASHTAEVILDNCRIPKENLMPGPGGSGGLGALKMLEATRPGVGAAALGVARAAYEYALEYAQQRNAFGKPILANQGVSFKLADMATEIHAARLMVHYAAWMAAQGKPTALYASMAKLKAGDAAVQAALDAIQILGGYGYTREYPVEKWLRDAKIYQIWEGTAEIQRLVISRALSGRLG